jgi:hypothetical protein
MRKPDHNRPKEKDLPYSSISVIFKSQLGKEYDLRRIAKGAYSVGKDGTVDSLDYFTKDRKTYHLNPELKLTLEAYDRDAWANHGRLTFGPCTAEYWAKKVIELRSEVQKVQRETDMSRSSQAVSGYRTVTNEKFEKTDPMIRVEKLIHDLYRDVSV